MTPEAAYDPNSRCVCGHLTSHHDAGECWTAPDGSETWDEVPGRCKCAWYEQKS